MRISRMVFAGFVSAACVGISGVAAGATTGQVPKNVVETQAAKVLGAETGQKLPKVTCPSGLKAKVGASIKCTLVPKGSKLKYPVKVTVRSIRKGTAHFDVQVGQAPGAANKTEFCADNAIIAKATSTAQTAPNLIPIFEANQDTILDFQATAPSKIVKDAGTLVHAAAVAVKTDNADAFTTAGIQGAIQRVDAFCGQNVDGSPVGSVTTTTG